MQGHRLGVDIGGTFTDFCLLDGQSGDLISYKVPSTRSAPAVAVRQGLEALVRLGIDPQAIEYFVHGATIAVNTVLQRNGARIALLVTDGFRDVLEIGRLRLLHPFDFNSTRPAPLVPRERVLTIAERILTDGSVDVPIDEGGARAAISRALEMGVEGFAVCLLSSYRNPVHERRLQTLLAEMAPDTPVSCSVDVWPQMREYERAMATVINAYTQPVVSAYLGALGDEVAAAGLSVRPYITRSNGGVMTAAYARTATAETLLSGPASGVIGAAYVAGQAGFSELITLDLGGTSADIAVVQSGIPITSQEEHIGEFPVIIPSVAVSSIGAGGGSVAHVDGAGVLKVGPRSAGAEPGPACYGHGGDEPTLTDAFVVAGLLNPEYFLGGRLAIFPALAEQALARLGHDLGCDAAGAADAVIYVATSAMYSEFSSLIAKRGIDARDFCLVAFGGAGALEACLLAREFNMRHVLVPRSPGTLCALGALAADVANDYIYTIGVPLDAASVAGVAEAYAELRRRADEWLRSEGPVVESSRALLSADTRYVGQAYEIEVPVDAGWLTGDSLQPLALAHHRAHERMYAHADMGSRIELVNLRLRMVGTTRKPTLQRVPRTTDSPPLHATRAVRYEHRSATARVYRRERLLAGHRLDGPCIVEQPDTTVFVPEGFVGTVDVWGNIVIDTPVNRA